MWRLFILFLLAPSANGAPETYEMDEMVLGGTRTLKSHSYLPQAINQLPSQELRHQGVRNIPDAMKSVPGVMSQKTAHGQGSPYIRGFTGFRTLYLIDGIRLNNSIFRSGPNEYSNLIDTYSLKGLEIVKGPASVLYGSDAIGGAVLASTAKGSLESPKSTDLQTLVRVAEGEQSTIGRLSWNQVFEKEKAYHIGLTYKKFGDMRPGAGEDRLEHTGYDEVDYELSSEQRLWGGTLRMYHQVVRQDDVWRTHKTIYGRSYKGSSVGKELQRLKDLRRSLTYLRYKSRSPEGGVRGLEATLSYQTLYEERDRIKASNERDLQSIDVVTTGVQIQMDSMVAQHEITYGIELYHDAVDSKKEGFDADGTSTGFDIQGPVGDDAKYTNLGLYVQDFYLATPDTSFIFGIRHNHVDVDVGHYKDPLSGSDESLDESYDGTIGSFKALHSLDEKRAHNIYGSISQGFRAPNLSDLTRFDDSRSNFEEIPSTGLKPEIFLTYELGYKLALKDFGGQLALYQTDVTDMIVRKPVATDATGAILTEKRNSGDGYIRGAEVDVQMDLTQNLGLRIFHARMASDISSYPDATETKGKSPQTRMMPDTSKVVITHKSPMTKLSLGWTHVESQKKLSFSDQSDTQRIPPGGTPGYDTLDIKFSHRLPFMGTESWAHIAVENATDENYRIHGSGQNEVGRNLIVTLDGRF